MNSWCARVWFMRFERCCSRHGLPIATRSLRRTRRPSLESWRKKDCSLTTPWILRGRCPMIRPTIISRRSRPVHRGGDPGDARPALREGRRGGLADPQPRPGPNSLAVGGHGAKATETCRTVLLKWAKSGSRPRQLWASLEMKSSREAGRFLENQVGSGEVLQEVPRPRHQRSSGERPFDRACRPQWNRKVVVIRCAQTWHHMHGGHGAGLSAEYHLKVGEPALDWGQVVQVDFHEPLPSGGDESRKLFYIRSAYRNEADFSVSTFQKMGSALETATVPRLIDNDIAVSSNFQRLVSLTLEGVYSGEWDSATVRDVRDAFIGEVRESMRRIFPDLLLQGIGDPLAAGTFTFEKVHSGELTLTARIMSDPLRTVLVNHHRASARRPSRYSGTEAYSQGRRPLCAPSPAPRPSGATGACLATWERFDSQVVLGGRDSEPQASESCRDGNATECGASRFGLQRPIKRL